MSNHRGRRLAVALTILAFAVVVFAIVAHPGVAAAHAVFVSSEPADGESVAQAPADVRVTFDETINLTAAVVELRDGTGNVIAANPAPNAAVVLLPLSVGPPTTGTTMTVTVPPLGHGVYQLRWRVVSADDFHPTTGALTFGVGQSVLASGATNAEQAPSTLVVGAGWLDLAAVALLIGALGVGELLPIAAVTALRRRDDDADAVVAPVGVRLARLARRAAGAAIATRLALLGATSWAAVHAAGAASVADAIVRQATRSAFLLSVVSAAAIVVILRRRPVDGGGEDRPPAPGSPRTHTALCLAVALVGLASQDSHVVTAGAGSRLATLVLTFHLLAASFWIGGVVTLALVVMPLRRRRGPQRVLANGMLRAFGGPAAVAAFVLVVTGLHLTGRQVASVDAGLRSLYGHVLGAKLALALVAGVAGLFNHDGIRQRGKTHLPHRALVLEASVGLLVLGAAAVLAGSPPARGARYESARTGHAVASVAGRAADLFVTVAVTPNQPGRAFLNVDVADTRRPAPGLVTMVQVAWTPPGSSTAETFTATQIEITTWQVAGLTIASAGTGHVDVRVSRAGLPAAGFAHAWVVPALASPLAPTLVSRRPLAPIADALALAGLATAAGWGLVRWRRTRQAQSTMTAFALVKQADSHHDPLLEPVPAEGTP